MTNANATDTPGHASAKKRFGIKARTETPVRQARPRPRLAVTVLGTMDLEELLNGDQLTVPMAPEHELLAIETPAPVAPIEIVQHLAAVDFTRPWVEVDETATEVSAPEAAVTDTPASNPFPDATAIVASEPATPAPPAIPPAARKRRATITPHTNRTLDEDLRDLLAENAETAPNTPAPTRRNPRRSPDADATVPAPVAATPAATETTPAPATPADSAPVAWETPDPWDAPAPTTTTSPRTTAPRRARRTKETPEPAAPVTDAVADAPLPVAAEPNPASAPEVVTDTPKARAKTQRAKTPRVTPVDTTTPPAAAPDAVADTPKPRAKARRAKTPRVTPVDATVPTIEALTEPAPLAMHDELIGEPAAPLESAPAVADEPAVEAMPVTEELPFAPMPASDPAPPRRRRSARPAIERVDSEAAAPLVASPISAPVAEPGWPQLGELTRQPEAHDPSPRGATYTIGLRVGIPAITPDPGFTPYQPVYEGSPHRGHDDTGSDGFVSGPQTLRREALARAVQEALDGV